MFRTTAWERMWASSERLFSRQYLPLVPVAKASLSFLLQIFMSFFSVLRKQRPRDLVRERTETTQGTNKQKKNTHPPPRKKNQQTNQKQKSTDLYPKSKIPPNIQDSAMFTIRGTVFKGLGQPASYIWEDCLLFTLGFYSLRLFHTHQSTLDTVITKPNTDNSLEERKEKEEG